MNATNRLEHLHKFQETGDTNSLLEHVRAIDDDEKGYQAAIILLKPVFSRLSFGEQPDYERLDWEALAKRKIEVGKIITWTADSSKANLKTAGLELMGRAAWADFIPRLQQHLHASATWERLAAIKAVGHFGHAQAASLLDGLTNDPDPDVQQAVRAILKP